MADAFPSHSASSAGSAALISPNDNTDLPNTTRAIYVGSTGDIKVDLEDAGTAILFKNVPVGILPVRAKRVYATGTGASLLVALW